MGEEESGMCLRGGGGGGWKCVDVQADDGLQIHRQAIMARANVSTQPRRSKGKNTMKFPYK